MIFPLDAGGDRSLFNCPDKPHFRAFVTYRCYLEMYLVTRCPHSGGWNRGVPQYSITDPFFRYTRKSIELDHASHIKFSPDGRYAITFFSALFLSLLSSSRAVIVTLSVSNTIHVYGIMKGSTTNLSDTIVEFPKVKFVRLCPSMHSIIYFGGAQLFIFYELGKICQTFALETNH